jgi:hypothetical protein
MNLFFFSIKQTETELFLGNLNLDQPTYVCWNDIKILLLRKILVQRNLKSQTKIYP